MKIECKGGIATPLQSVSRAPLKTRVGSIGQCRPLLFLVAATIATSRTVSQESRAERSPQNRAENAW